MTDREILSNAIDKAIANGWDWDNKNFTPINSYDSRYDESIIFSHSFAKAFFSVDPDPNFWKVKLQEMVLEENPIQYLAKFL